MDGLATAAFGMNVNSFGSEESLFTKYAAELFKVNGLEVAKLMLKYLVPGMDFVLETFNINLWKKKETKFFYDVIKSSIKARREGRQERRNDLIDLMMDAITQDLPTDAEGQEQYEKDMTLKVDNNKAIDEDMVVATAMVFMMAGYDTTATTLSYASYRLSKHPEQQEKLQEEVDQAFADADGQFPDYSTIQSMTYLDMVIHETLRLHSPVPVNTREAGADYTIPGTNMHLKKGDLVSFVPTALQKDPAHWSHPDDFYPEHFSKEEKAGRSPYAFQAFGQGPRACIGMRFALLEAKVALVALCRKFTFLPSTKTQEPLVQDPSEQLLWPIGGLWVRLERRE